MVTQRVDILIAIKLLTCFSHWGSSSKGSAFSPAAKNPDQSVWEEKRGVILKCVSGARTVGGLHTFQASWALEESIVSSSDQGLLGARTKSGFGQQEAA